VWATECAGNASVGAKRNGVVAMAASLGVASNMFSDVIVGIRASCCFQ
jgi:hypothetical protein